MTQPILEVESRRFLWSPTDGFSFRSGSETRHGLHRTAESAQARVESLLTTCRPRTRTFVAGMLDAETMTMADQLSVRHEKDVTMVSGRLFRNVEAQIED